MGYDHDQIDDDGVEQDNDVGCDNDVNVDAAAADEDRDNCR